jgi:hypothetical protein
MPTRWREELQNAGRRNIKWTTSRNLGVEKLTLFVRHSQKMHARIRGRVVLPFPQSTQAGPGPPPPPLFMGGWQGL